MSTDFTIVVKQFLNFNKINSEFYEFHTFRRLYAIFCCCCCRNAIVLDFLRFLALRFYLHPFFNLLYANKEKKKKYEDQKQVCVYAYNMICFRKNIFIVWLFRDRSKKNWCDLFVLNLFFFFFALVV